jgi:hypothetical protein
MVSLQCASGTGWVHAGEAIVHGAYRPVLRGPARSERLRRTDAALLEAPHHECHVGFDVVEALGT